MKVPKVLADWYWRLIKRYRPIQFFLHKELEVWKLYEPDIASAKNDEERRQAESMRRFECSEYIDSIRSLESHQWMIRAEKVHLSVYDIPLIEHEEHWATGPHGDAYLSDRVFRTLKKQVEAAEYERNHRKRERWEILLKYVTAGAAIVGALAALLNLYIASQKK
jgi:hypothetical protein